MSLFTPTSPRIWIWEWSDERPTFQLRVLLLAAGQTDHRYVQSCHFLTNIHTRLLCIQAAVPYIHITFCEPGDSKMILLVVWLHMGEYQSNLLILRYSVAYFWVTTQTWFLKRVTELCLWIPDLWPPLVMLFQWKIEETHQLRQKTTLDNYDMDTWESTQIPQWNGIFYNLFRWLWTACSRTALLFSSEKCNYIQLFGNHLHLICRCCDEPTRAPCSWKHHSPPWLWGCSSCTSSTPAGWCMASCTLNLATTPKVTNASCHFWRGTLNYRFIHILPGCVWLLWACVQMFLISGSLCPVEYLHCSAAQRRGRTHLDPQRRPIWCEQQVWEVWLFITNNYCEMETIFKLNI